MPESLLIIPDTPPSLNKVGASQDWRVVAKFKRIWQAQLASALLVARNIDPPDGPTRLPRTLRRVHATAILRFPKQRRRDEGNYRALLEKALGDALQHGGFLDDDTPDTFTFGQLTFDEQRGSHQTLITLLYEVST